jgi:hypothetical protein
MLTFSDSHLAGVPTQYIGPNLARMFLISSVKECS